MKQLSSLILLAPLVGCASSPVDATPDAGVDQGSGDVDTDGTQPVGPDLACVVNPQPTTAPEPMILSGQVAALGLTGASPVPDVEVALFRAGQPIVLARTHSAQNGTFSTGQFSSGGHPVHAYFKGTKSDFRTTFYYPPNPFATNATNVPVPMVSDALFTTVEGLLGATQNDNKNGALLIAVADCNGQPVAGATLQVLHGNSPVGQVHDLGTLIPSEAGTYLVFNVPDGKARVSASYNGAMFPQHDVMVRSKDPDCETAVGTITATSIVPGP